ncbi:unnamed protein product [Notodromas monacha]|uniref:Uncharacterized protein n=1 Tax=Notodromas monacha TaxID=399045 RepID=A0A7R9GJS2_9CRUS|nr:unnamed protein product [Notodromas monacha]CAG0923874.1 unnamed protein product [Notodromas monacha]
MQNAATITVLSIVIHCVFSRDVHAQNTVLLNHDKRWFLWTKASPNFCSKVDYEMDAEEAFPLDVFPPDLVLTTWTIPNEASESLEEDVKSLVWRLNSTIINQHLYDMDYLFAYEFVQHSPGKADGVKGLVEFYTAIDPFIYSYQPVVELYEGPFAVIFSKQIFSKAGPQAVVDIYLAKDSKLAEHWDVVRSEPVKGPNRSGRSLFEVSLPQMPTTAEERRKNKEIAVNAINGYRNMKSKEAVNHFFSKDLVQHSIGSADGTGSLVTGFSGSTDVKVDIKIVVASGDLVAVYSKVDLKFSGNPVSFALMDIFRIFGCKITEHWSINEPLPKGMKNYKNSNGPF